METYSSDSVAGRLFGEIARNRQLSAEFAIATTRTAGPVVSAAEVSAERPGLRTSQSRRRHPPLPWSAVAGRCLVGHGSGNARRQGRGDSAADGPRRSNSR